MRDSDRAALLADLLPAKHKPQPYAQFVRELTEADLRTPSLHERGAGKSIKNLHQAHHTIARWLALGRPLAEISLVSGYNLAYISSLQQNETFQELLLHYSTIDSIAEADIKQQLNSTGTLALGELRRRLEDEPEDMPTNMLLETVKVTLVEAQKGQPPMAPSSAPAFNVTFVNAQQPQAGATIELEPEDYQ